MQYACTGTSNCKLWVNQNALTYAKDYPGTDKQVKMRKYSYFVTF